MNTMELVSIQNMFSVLDDARRRSISLEWLVVDDGKYLYTPFYPPVFEISGQLKPTARLNTSSLDRGKAELAKKRWEPGPQTHSRKNNLPRVLRSIRIDVYYTQNIYRASLNPGAHQRHGPACETAEPRT